MYFPMSCIVLIFRCYHLYYLGIIHVFSFVFVMISPSFLELRIKYSVAFHILCSFSHKITMSSAYATYDTNGILLPQMIPWYSSGTSLNATPSKLLMRSDDSALPCFNPVVWNYSVFSWPNLIVHLDPSVLTITIDINFVATTKGNKHLHISTLCFGS